MWFIGDVVRDTKNSRKMFSKKVKYAVEAYYCLDSKNVSFRFFQHNGTKICVKH